MKLWQLIDARKAAVARRNAALIADLSERIDAHILAIGADGAP